TCRQLLAIQSFFHHPPPKFAAEKAHRIKVLVFLHLTTGERERERERERESVCVLSKFRGFAWLCFRKHCKKLKRSGGGSSSDNLAATERDLWKRKRRLLCDDIQKPKYRHQCQGHPLAFSFQTLI
ncbi:hypothetical protein U1Q18_009613, partial [Sarracenia purpurea var. burkii]